MVTVEMTYERATKNTVRFKAKTLRDRLYIATLYIAKETHAELNHPSELTVTLEGRNQ